MTCASTVTRCKEVTESSLHPSHAVR